MRNAKVLEGGKRTDRRGYQVISDEKKGADNGDDFTSMTHAGVDATAVWIKAANDHVIDSDERRQHTHGGDQPERGVTGDGKGEANYVGLAGAPVSVKDGRRARNIDIARSPGCG